MCKYFDKVHRCGHYERTVDICDDAHTRKALCSEEVIAERSYSSNLKWCEIAGCTKRPANKREGPGIPIRQRD